MSAAPHPVVVPVRRRMLLAATAGAVVAVALGPGPAAVAGPPPAAVGVRAVAEPVPVPQTPAELPVVAESLQPFVPATSCNPRAKPGTVALGELLRATYPGTRYGIARTCGTDPLRTSEHYEGRALDWMVSARDPLGAARAQAALDWLLATDANGVSYANARRLGVMYVIWDGRIWGSYRASSGWRPYSTCALHPGRSWDTRCHRDHVHLSLGWAGARKKTSFWTRKVARTDYGPCRPPDLNWAGVRSTARRKPCPAHPLVTAPAGSGTQLVNLVKYSGMRLTRGMTGPVVAAVQAVIGAQPDGQFGPLTASAVRRWQADRGLRATGTVDAATWRKVLAAARSGPPSVTPEPPGSAKAKPKAKPKARAKSSLPPVNRRPVLSVGSRGALVKAVQKRLRITADGVFGRGTRAAVKRFQATHGIRTTGNVGPLTWKALKI